MPAKRLGSSVERLAVDLEKDDCRSKEGDVLRKFHVHLKVSKHACRWCRQDWVVRMRCNTKSCSENRSADVIEKWPTSRIGPSPNALDRA